MRRLDWGGSRYKHTKQTLHEHHGRELPQRRESMRARNLTLTGIGLPVRAELRLKSLLEVINSKTTDRWSYVEQGDAHVAICDPASALSAVTMRRGASGPTRFFSLVEDASLAAVGTGVIRDPIRASDLIELLNLVSSTLSCEAPQKEWAALTSSTNTSTDGRDAFPVAVALRGLARAKGQAAYVLQAGAFEMHVMPAARTVHLMEPVDEQGLRSLAGPGVPISIRELPATRAGELVAHSCKLDELLWRLGLHGEKSRLLPELPVHAWFKLRRWPDFGRIEHTPDHVRLASRLVRQKATVLELAIAAGLPVSKANSFINACCLCDLIEVHAVEHTARVATSTQPTRYAGIFKTIRSVLGFGAAS
jgi:hypothetical protein